MSVERSKTDYIVIHCSATPPDMDIGREEITKWHKARGFREIGYHFVIRRNGGVERGRWVLIPGAHVKGYNSVSVGVCMVGGVDSDMKPEDNFTGDQWGALLDVVSTLKGDFPEAKIVGHTELDSGKACPSFDVQQWVKRVNLIKEE